MSGFLLDTHALAWWWTRSERLTHAARALIDAGDRTIYVSAATPWEMATKHRVGRWPEMTPFLSHFEALVAESRFRPLPISLAHARLAGGLQAAHRDPFDRMLAAQAIAESLTLISRDSAFAAFGLTCVWRESPS